MNAEESGGRPFPCVRDIITPFIRRRWGRRMTCQLLITCQLCNVPLYGIRAYRCGIYWRNYVNTTLSFRKLVQINLSQFIYSFFSFFLPREREIFCNFVTERLEKVSHRNFSIVFRGIEENR